MLPGPSSGVVPQIAGKTRDGGNDDDDAELSTFPTRSDACIDDGTSNGVVHRSLLLSSCRNCNIQPWGPLTQNTGRLTEELILDVDVMLCRPDDITVGILNAVFGENATTPVAAAPNDLSVHGALLGQAPRCEWRDRMMNVSADGVFGPLHADEILVGALATFQGQPRKTGISFVLVTLHKIPSLPNDPAS